MAGDPGRSLRVGAEPSRAESGRARLDRAGRCRAAVIRQNGVTFKLERDFISHKLQASFCAAHNRAHFGWEPTNSMRPADLFQSRKQSGGAGTQCGMVAARLGLFGLVVDMHIGSTEYDKLFFRDRRTQLKWFCQ